MQLTAKLMTLLPLQTGKGKNGDWKKQDFIVETGDTDPKKICISVWGNKINSSHLVVGNEIRIDFDVESREYNRRWYTDVKAWKIELASAVTIIMRLKLIMLRLKIQSNHSLMMRLRSGLFRKNTTKKERMAITWNINHLQIKK